MNTSSNRARVRRRLAAAVVVSVSATVWCGLLLSGLITQGPRVGQVGTVLIAVAAWLRREAGAPDLTIVTVRPPWSALNRGLVLAAAIGIAVVGLLTFGTVAAVVLALALVLAIREATSVQISELGVHRSFDQVDRWAEMPRAFYADGRLSYLCPDGQQRVWRSIRVHPGVPALLKAWLPTDHPVRAALRGGAA